MATYHEFGFFGTRRGAFWFTLLMLVFSMIVVTLRQDAIADVDRFVLRIFWILASAVASNKILIRLGRLEKERGEPDAAMKLAFDAALGAACFMAGIALI